MSARRLQVLLIALATLTLVVLAVPSSIDLVRSRAMAGVRLLPSTTVAAATSRSAPSTVPEASTTTAPARPQELFVLTDSVVLGAQEALARRLSGWKLSVEGGIGLDLKKAADLLEQRSQRVAPTVIVSLGYSSIWEKNRRHFDHWAAQFDAEADAIVAQLRSLGAKEIVWVTLRELDAAIVPSGWRSQLNRYGFYFPYVNERLRVLPQRNPDVVLADWSSASQQSGLTIDAIHVNPKGAELLVDVITQAAGITVPPVNGLESASG